MSARWGEAQRVEKGDRTTKRNIGFRRRVVEACALEQDVLGEVQTPEGFHSESGLDNGGSEILGKVNERKVVIREEASDMLAL